MKATNVVELEARRLARAREEAYDQGLAVGFMRGVLVGLLAALVTLGCVAALWGAFR